MERKAFYLQISIEGIQKYISSTGKLREMIGGSEIINYLASPEFYEPILNDLKIEEDRELSGRPGCCMVAQANAGALCLILPTLQGARDFLATASRQLLAAFPGLPFYGAISEFVFEDSPKGCKTYRLARKQAHEIICARRNAAPTPQGCGLMPMLRAARLDGLPAVAKVDKELISLASAARRNPAMLERSRKRLQGAVQAPAGLELAWKDDLQEILGGAGDKVALICMDGNDLGKLFGQHLQDSADKSLCQSLRAMRELSQRVEACNREAFSHACRRIAQYEAMHRKETGTPIVMPLRPLVMGGDDITIIARADIALPFVEMFTRSFDELGRKDKFSLGIGMVVMDASYPFAKAFPLAESLQDSAKKLTSHLEPARRPSSLDYLVLTEDVENEISAVRQRLFTCPDGEILTGKPFVMRDRRFLKFLDQGCAVVTKLPRSQIREAWTVCRRGPDAVRSIWLNLRDNIARNIGGRKGRLLTAEEFRAIFPENFFVAHELSGQICTSLGDYLELERLLPAEPRAREALLTVMKAPAGEEDGNV